MEWNESDHCRFYELIHLNVGGGIDKMSGFGLTGTLVIINNVWYQINYY